MFSYRHAFHAGNHADVLKHTVLIATLEYMLEKDAALTVIDTHAGAGLYRLDGDYADTSGEAVWPMPMPGHLRSGLDSDIADLRQVASDRSVGGGAVTAALFLREFAGARRWAHLDIAGPARATSARHEVPKGATGFGARLLLAWLESLR